jgi:hypothetical protein
MSNKQDEEEKKVTTNEENPEENGEEKENEEEPVDLELQKEIKGLKISDSDFAKEDNNKKQNKKMKKTNEKTKKKKGKDFVDYANQNNIQFNIEYEEDKYQLEKREDKKVEDKTKYNNSNYYNNYNNKKRPYNNNRNDRNNQNRRTQKFYGNKFDKFEKNDNYYNYNQRPQQYNNYYAHRTPKLAENKEIMEFLENIMDEKNLNKNIYLRKKLDKNGRIDVNDVIQYNVIKKNNLGEDKILEAIKDSQKFEIVNEDNKKYIKVKDFDKFNLLPLEQMIENKNNMKQQKMQYFQQMWPPYYMPIQYMQPYNPYFYQMQNNP